MARTSTRQALDHSTFLFDLHARIAASMADSESRDDHFRDAAEKSAAVGMADIAFQQISFIDDDFFRCMGWADVGLALARKRHAAAIVALAEADTILEGYHAIEPSMRMEFSAQLAVGDALSGGRQKAQQRIRNILAQLEEEHCLQQRIDIVSLIIEATYLTDLVDLLEQALNIAFSTIDKIIAGKIPNNHAVTTLVKALRVIGRQDQAGILVRKAAHRMIGTIGAGENDYSPVFIATMLMELAVEIVKGGDVSTACWVAGMAFGLRTHPAVRFRHDFDVDSPYLNFASFFFNCASAWGENYEAIVLNTLELAHTTNMSFPEVNGYTSHRELADQSIYKFDAYLVIGRIDEAERWLKLSEQHFFYYWEISRQRKLDIDIELYHLTEIAMRWWKFSCATHN